jgi:hypothetical protein
MISHYEICFYYTTIWKYVKFYLLTLYWELWFCFLCKPDPLNQG